MIRFIIDLFMCLLISIIYVKKSSAVETIFLLHSANNKKNYAEKIIILYA